MKLMKSSFILGIILFGQLSHAQSPECTQESREKWMKTDEMKKKAESLGYKIKRFMTLEKCYEISGELSGKKVTHYFDPVTGTLFEVQSRSEKK
jgi:hypothetical protein